MMQRSALTEEEHKNELAQTEFRFIKIIITKKRGGAITRRPSPLHQRCTAAKDGIFQGDHLKQSQAEDSIA
jgi:hypothetical protein